jgi:hypothetical protein
LGLLGEKAKSNTTATTAARCKNGKTKQKTNHGFDPGSEKLKGL